MEVSETLSEGLKREYKVVVEAADMEAKVTSRLSDIAKEAQMPGFRRGKVPVTILRKTYGKQLLGEVLEQTVNETTTETIKNNEVFLDDKKQFSPASLISIAGGILAITGLISYFNDATNLSVPTFFYGVPILLIGLALKNSELDPANNSISASDISKLSSKSNDTNDP